MKRVETIVRPGGIEFFLRLLGLWEGLVSLPPPPEPPFDIETFEPIEPPCQAIRAWTPADDDGSPTETPELWDQSTGTAWQAPEIYLGDGRTLVLEYTRRPRTPARSKPPIPYKIRLPKNVLAGPNAKVCSTRAGVYHESHPHPHSASETTTLEERGWRF